MAADSNNAISSASNVLSTHGKAQSPLSTPLCVPTRPIGSSQGKEEGDSRVPLNLVVVGHVDAGIR